MKIKPAGPKLPVVNYDAPAQEGVFRKHGSLFGGESKRALIVGASGSGKTNIMISLITHPNGLRFSNVYIYCKSPYQPKYQYLRKVLEPLKEIGYFEYTDDKICTSKPNQTNSLIIFDDVAHARKTSFDNTIALADIEILIVFICAKLIQPSQNIFCVIMLRCSSCYHKIF
nr:unnamed protein product [Callosobruchus analis]